jgi:calcium channel MID1
MQLPKLTPLQARLLASVIATCVLVVIWIEFQPKYFVYASELPAAPEDGLHSQFGHAIPQNEESIQTGEGKREEQAQIREKQHGESGYSVTIEGQGGNGAQEDVGYMPDFAYFDRSLIGRQKEQVTNLTNNVKDERDSSEGVTTHFVLPKSQLKIKREEEGPATHAELNTRETENISKKGVDEEAETEEEHIEKRQNTQRVWISANACRQPLPTTELITESNSPQLILYVSTSTKNQKPGPKSKNDLAADPIVFEGGYANFLVQTDSDIFIGVEAPLLTDGWAGSWHFEIAASTDGYYHGYHADETFLFMVDTDSESALFITPNITAGNDTAEIKKWSDMDPLPFVIYTQPTAKWGPMTGLERSFCALETALNNTGKITVKSTITTNFGDAERNLGKAQFHVQGLENGTAYQGFLAINGTKEGLVIPGVGLVKNGGQVWRQFNWTTKAGKHDIDLLLLLSTILTVRQTTLAK